MNKRNKYDRMYNIWSLTIAVCLCATMFSLVFISCQKNPDKATATASPASSPAASEAASPSPGATSPVESGEPAASGEPVTSEEPTASAEPSAGQGTSAVLGETADMGQTYVNRFVFLGDSTTYGLGYYNVVDKSQIWTPESGTLTLSQWSFTAIVYPDDGRELLISDAVRTKKPEYMLITLGVNGVSFMDEEYFKAEYTKLVQTIIDNSPSTRVIINSIYPVAASYTHLDQINNDKISAANGWLQQVAEDLGVPYLDSESALLGSDGYLPESLQNGDGMHLTAEGFQLVINYLRTHGYQ